MTVKQKLAELRKQQLEVFKQLREEKIGHREADEKVKEANSQLRKIALEMRGQKNQSK